MKYLFDLSCLSASYYLGKGRAYGVGRVVLGLARELHLRFGQELKFSSYSDNAEMIEQLRNCAGELIPSAVEYAARPWEKRALQHMKGLREMADGNGGWSSRRAAKAFRQIWWQYDNGWRHAFRNGGKAWCQKAKVIHADSMHALEKFADPSRLLSTVHDLIPHHSGDQSQLARLRTLAAKGVHFITVSRYVSEDLTESLPGASSRIHWFRNGLDPVFKPCNDKEAQKAWLLRLGLREDEPYFVTQTGFHRRKNLAGAVRAVYQLREEQKIPFRLVLAGYTKAVRETLDETIPCSMRWRDFTIFTGMLDDEDFPPIYARAIALIFLSRAEGFGYAPLEAMGCGLPAIGSNRTSIPEVIGDAGPVFDPDDLDGVCGEMLKLSTDQLYRNDRIERSLRQAARFTWQAAASRVGDVWEQIEENA